MSLFEKGGEGGVRSFYIGTTKRCLVLTTSNADSGCIVHIFNAKKNSNRYEVRVEK